ncbi:MAG: LPS assembly lipoprotein LptE [Planctomycetota bacterium]
MSRRLGVALALLLTALAGCGWHTGLVAPEGAESVGVDWFALDEDVLERDLEPALHDALSRAVSDLVGLRLVAPEDADLVIRGRIGDYGRRGGIRGRDHQLLESAVRITVDARLERRAGQVVASSRAALPSGYVTANRVADDDFEVGGAREEDRARERLLRFLAEEIVLELFAPQEEPVP